MELTPGLQRILMDRAEVQAQEIRAEREHRLALSAVEPKCQIPAKSERKGITQLKTSTAADV